MTPKTDTPRPQRRFRNRMCDVIRTTQNIQTGAIYDHIEYTRQVTNRLNDTVSTETLIRKLRRPGTGVAAVAKEVEIEVTVDG